MSVMFKPVLLVGLLLVMLLSGCGTPTIMSEKWHLPKKAAADSAMVIGHIDLPDNKAENPKNKHLNLTRVVFTWPRRFYTSFDTKPKGEQDYVMNDTNIYVIPNLKPGKYHLSGFVTDDIYNSLPADDDTLIEVKPGQILYLGSLEYLEIKQGFFSKFVGDPGTYKLRLANHPTELEILEWLSRVDEGSGWEATIKRRIKELGGKF